VSNHLKRAELAKEMKVFDYFTLGLGAMLGAAWFVLMAGNIQKAGPLGTALAFAASAVFLIPIGLCYSELTASIPVAGGELGFTYAASGTKMSYSTGWLLILAYAILCPWEVVAVGSLLGVVFPIFRTMPMYTVVDYVIYFPQFAVEMILAIAIIYYNYTGIKRAAKVQTFLAKFMLTCFVIFLTLGICFGKVENLYPLVAKVHQMDGTTYGGIGGFLAVLAITPFFYCGFDTIPQAAEEGSLGISLKDLGKTLTYSILAGGSFYVVLIFSVSMIMPWPEMTKLPVPMAQLFTAAKGWKIVSQIVIWGAMAGLITTLNAFFVAATRVVFALGRANLMPKRFGEVHPKYQTPTYATYFVGALTIMGPFIGKPLIAPFTNVGSLAFMVVWFAICYSAYKLRVDAPTFTRPYSMMGGKGMAILGMLASLIIIATLVVPRSPGALKPFEHLMFALWIGIGVVNWFITEKRRNEISIKERTYMILGEKIKNDLEKAIEKNNMHIDQKDQVS
jgi:amino acid transporter